MSVLLSEFDAEAVLVRFQFLIHFCELPMDQKAAESSESDTNEECDAE